MVKGFCGAHSFLISGVATGGQLTANLMPVKSPGCERRQSYGTSAPLLF